MSIFPILAVVLVVAILIGFNALYVAGEFSTVSARRPRLTQMAEEGSRVAKMLLGVIKNPRQLDNYVAASQVGITISSIVLGMYGQQAIAPRIEPWLSGVAGEAAAGSSAVIVLIFFTILQVVFGIVIIFPYLVLLLLRMFYFSSQSLQHICISFHFQVAKDAVGCLSFKIPHDIGELPNKVDII